MKKLKIFWTGGYDSTFMLCKLARETKYEIEPIYIVNKKGRGTYKRELASMKEIHRLLKQKDELSKKISDLVVIDLKEVPQDNQITDALSYFRSKGKIGDQYEYLARYAKDNGPIGLGLEYEPSGMGTASNLINKYGKTTINQDGYKQLDRKSSSKEILLLFGNMFFPIFDITEETMRDEIHRWGYDDVMSNIWFCFSPINNEPCGLCHPCEEKMNCGMEHLISPKGQKRYYRFKKLEFLGKKRLDNLKKWYRRHRSEEYN